MTLGQQILFFFSGIGAFNGLLLGSYLLFVRKLKYIPDFFLGLLLLMLSTRVGISVCFYFDQDWPRIIPHLGLAALYFVGPALYYFVLSSFQQEQFNIRKCKKNFSTLTIVLGVVGFLYLIFPVTWMQYFGAFIYGVWMTFVLLSVYQYYILSKKKSKNLNRYVLPVLVSNVIIFSVYELISVEIVEIYCLSGSIVFSFILYVNFLILFNRKYHSVGLKEGGKYSNKKICDERADNFVTRLDQLMYTEELYKNPNLKLSDLASKMNISAHQLSQLLNDNLGKSFSIYVNEYRIEEACRIITSDSFLKIEEIGYEVGFNSKSTFFSTFKKIKNATPQLYRNAAMD
ncbi:helix-turn-helix domain-containing protein [Elizabethkingia bruuniana]|uniref:helix-turn-helix domain-containing protein n=1 Tax=Elizabethkingia bruuniana TaxID=1756149 RepID=UPI0009995314|nr:AraC family transcriptional regulator [Elizabethkingia bruuniana]OPC52579.1 DNA-binding protein [Elizabethkingia bruuniana]OPC60278.1 DNA-binding protein [Elizabethkingia bruuniana]RBI89655.1 AraC family transcriptional regulator [Elizabethkingia miricola]